MLILNKNVVELDVKAETAEDAIRKAGALLVKDGKVEERYVEAMVKCYKDVGPYIVLAPQIAIPHARPEYGVCEMGASLIRLKKPIVFGHPTNDPVQLIVAICGTDSQSHIGMLQTIAAVLGDKSKFESILHAVNKEEIISIFK